jgi:hypothetical protein
MRRIAVVITLLLVTLLIVAGNAADRAQARAADVGDNIASLPAVAVYSSQDMAITGNGVEARRLTVADGRFRFRYSGLRLLAVGDESIVLIPERWQPSTGNVILLHRNSDFRLDFLGR